MKDRDDIVQAFIVLNDHLTDLGVSGPPSDGVLEKAARIKRMMLINSQAYFLLVFAQFEAELNRLCARLIERMKAQADWKDRRVWDDLEHHPDRIRNIPVMRKVALLTDRQGAVYRRIKELYDIRNRIAHGNLLTEELDVDEVAKEIQRVAAELNEAP